MSPPSPRVTAATDEAFISLAPTLSARLLPERAALLVEPGLLLVADVHVGKAASFRRLGVPVPCGTTEDNLARLDALLVRLGPAVRGLVFLGDFLHAATGRAEATLAALADWRRRHAALAMTLVRGNHDDRAGDPPAALGITVVEEPWLPAALPGLALCHDPALPLPDPARWAMAGHVHPMARLGRGFDGLTLPCFHWQARGEGAAAGATLVLPAFGAFTGGAMVKPAAADRLWLVGDGVVVERPFETPRRRRGIAR